MIIALTIAVFFTLYKHKQPQQIAQNQQNDIAPGTTKAILTLASGKNITVTEANKGTLATQANMQINKTTNGSFTYTPIQAERNSVTNTTKNAIIAMNTLSTQMGGETSSTLADGTEVKLDASSSITFPAEFNGKERRIAVTDQAYFKVKRSMSPAFSSTS